VVLFCVGFWELVTGMSGELVTTLWTSRRCRNGVRTPPYWNTSRIVVIQRRYLIRGLGGYWGNVQFMLSYLSYFWHLTHRMRDNGGPRILVLVCSGD